MSDNKQNMIQPPVADNKIQRKVVNITSSPHVRDNITTTNLMLYVIIGLLPATIWGIVQFGANAAMLVIVCIAASVLSEFVYQKLLKLPITINDLSAVVTGLLLAMNLPPTATWWMAVVGSVFAIIIVKQAYGGIGKNFMNPALGARCFLLISFTARMTSFAYKGVAGATPLAIVSGKVEGADLAMPTLKDMFLGFTSGTIGETSALLLIIGGLFLIIMKVVDFRVPLFYILSFTIFISIVGAAKGQSDLGYFILGNIFGGGLMMGAFFMATDYVTCPITDMGKVFYGILLGVLTGIIRGFGPSAEGVSYAIIISNMLAPIIEKSTVPLAFGLVKKERKKA